MINKISQKEAIEEALAKEGKISYFDEQEYFEAMLEMNEYMEEARHDHLIKERNSEVSAAKVVLMA